jgi:hypothetical protein
VGLERGPLSFAKISEELLERKVAARVWKTENHGRGEPPRNHPTLLYPQKLALNFADSGCGSVGIVPLGTETMEIVVLFCGC